MDALFPGLQAMENWHPLFVHAPVVLLPLALVFSALATWKHDDAWRRFAHWLLWLGTLGALAAAATGLLAEKEVDVPEAAWDVIAFHESVMLIATGLALVLSLAVVFLRRRMTRGLQISLLVGLLVLNGLLFVGADRGGQLVYQFGVSVQEKD